MKKTSKKELELLKEELLKHNEYVKKIQNTIEELEKKAEKENSISNMEDNEDIFDIKDLEQQEKELIENFHELRKDIKAKKKKQKKENANLLKQKLSNFKEKHGKKVITGSLIIALAAGAKSCNLDKKFFPKKVKDPNEVHKVYDELSADLAFDSNKEEEIINRLADLYVDASAKGMGEVTVDQWIDWYTVVNIDSISSNRFSQYLDDSKTVTEIMKNFDYVNNEIYNNALNADPNFIVNYGQAIANKNSAKAVNEFNVLVTQFNSSSSENKINYTDDINAYLQEEFLTNNYKGIDSASNLVRMKSLLSSYELTKDSKYTVPNSKLTEVMYPNNKMECLLTSKDNSSNIWNNEKEVVVQTLTEKINNILKCNQTDSFKRLELENAIIDLANKKGLVKVSRLNKNLYLVDTKKTVSKKSTSPVTKPKETTPGSKPEPKLEPEIIIPEPTIPPIEYIIPADLTEEVITPYEEKHIVVNPKTKEKEIWLPPTKESKQPTLDIIEKINQDEEERVAGSQDGFRDGDRNGYEDGSKNKRRNNSPTKNLSRYDSIYIEAYTSKYREAYNAAYKEGQKLYEGDIIVEKKFIPIEENINELTEIKNNNDKTEGYCLGDQTGYDDGFNNKSFNSEPKNIKDKTDVFKKSFKEAYEKSYYEGVEARKERDAINLNVNKNENSNSTNYEEESKIDNSNNNIDLDYLELLPGFHEKDGKIYDEDGNEVEIIGSTNIETKIMALNDLKNTISRSLNEIAIEKTFTI